MLPFEIAAPTNSASLGDSGGLPNQAAAGGSTNFKKCMGKLRGMMGAEKALDETDNNDRDDEDLKSGVGFVDMQHALDYTDEDFEINDELSHEVHNQYGMFTFTRPARRSLITGLGLLPRRMQPRNVRSRLPNVEDVYMKHSSRAAELTYLAVVLGCGVWDIPRAMAKTGWIPGLLTLAMFSRIEVFLCHRIIEVPHIYQQNMETYGDVAKHSLPWLGWCIITILIIMNWLGICSNYLVTTLKIVDRAFCGDHDCINIPMKLLLGICLVPLAFKTSSKHIRRASLASVSLTMSILLIQCVGIFVFIVEHNGMIHRGSREFTHNAVSDSLEELLDGMSDMLFPWAGAAIMPYVVSEMSDSQKAKRMATNAINKITLIFLIVAVFGYGAWGNDLKLRFPVAELVNRGQEGHPFLTFSAAAISVMSILRTLSNFPLYFWPLCREIESFAQLEDQLPVELNLPWAVSHAKLIKSRLRVFLVFAAIAPTLAPSFTPLKHFLAAIPLTIVEFVFPSCIGCIAVIRHVRRATQSESIIALEMSVHGGNIEGKAGAPGGDVSGNCSAAPSDSETRPRVESTNSQANRANPTQAIKQVMAKAKNVPEQEDDGQYYLEDIRMRVCVAFTVLLLIAFLGIVHIIYWLKPMFKF